MRKKTVVLLASAFLFAVSISLVAYMGLAAGGTPRLQLTAEEKQWLSSNGGRLTVTGDPDYPPLDFENPRGEHEGISESILSLIESSLGFSFRRLRSASWTAVMEAAENGSVDLVFCISPSESRKRFLDFTEPYITLPTVYFIHDSRTDIRSPSDLKGKKVCISRDYESFNYFKENNPGFEIIPTENDAEALSLVATGAVDAAVSDLPTLSFLVNREHITRVRVLGETGFDFQLSLGMRKGLSPLKSILDKVLKANAARINSSILTKWINVEYRNILYDSKTWFFVFGTTAAASTVLLLFLLWDRSLLAQVRLRTRELSDYKNRLEIMIADRTAELEMANRRLAVLATTDPLTGCCNRRQFFELCTREQSRVDRQGGLFAVVMFDLDDFKKVNDTHGHAVGDRVLVEVCKMVAASIRGIDVFGRLGGEEFYVLLPDTGLEDAVATAGRFRAGMERIDTVETGSGILRISASFGVAAYRKGDKIFTEALSRADSAMYRAKAAGKNRVEADSGDPP